MGKLVEAERLYREALRVQAATLGATHFEVGFNLGQLAALLHDRKRLDEARALYAQSLRIKRRRLGPKHPDVVLTEENAALLGR